MKLAAAKPAAASQKTNPRPPPATRGINSAIPIMMGAASRMLTTKHKLCQNLVVVLVNVPWPPKLRGTEKGESHDFRTWSHPGLHRSW